jgi:hypothetical protein
MFLGFGRCGPFLVLNADAVGCDGGRVRQALKAADGAEADKEGKEQRCLDVLKHLQGMAVSTALLMDTEAAKKLKKCAPPTKTGSRRCPTQEALLVSCRQCWSVVCVSALALPSARGAVRVGGATLSARGELRGRLTKHAKSDIATAAAELIKSWKATVTKEAAAKGGPPPKLAAVQLPEAKAAAAAKVPTTPTATPATGDAARDKLAVSLGDALAKVVEELGADAAGLADPSMVRSKSSPSA